jgi:hypothetical protein
MTQTTASITDERIRLLGQTQNSVGGSQECCSDAAQKPSPAHSLANTFRQLFYSHPRLPLFSGTSKAKAQLRLLLNRYNRHFVDQISGRSLLNRSRPNTSRATATCSTTDAPKCGMADSSAHSDRLQQVVEFSTRKTALSRPPGAFRRTRRSSQ